MTEISKYGVTFVRLNESHLEMVREWRNSDDVRPFMQYQKIITKEEQIKWFHRINNDNNFYFVAFIKEEPVGLYNIKDIDQKKKFGECGSFLKNRNYWESKETTSFNFLLLHISFEELKLDYVVCTVLKSNKKVLKLNLQLGYKEIEIEPKDNERLLLKLEYDSFKKSKSYKLVKYLELQ
jgi:UDP-4-amino-4,6-dideoxy-N-acetyl-beta-L-altrosamine N-acetyltransferase